MSRECTVVLITGANSGIGYAATKVILNASSSYHVILAGRSSQKIKNAAAEIQVGDIKGSLSTLVLDVTDQTSVEQAAKEVERQYGRVNVLVNNAGVASRDSNLKKQMEDTFLTNIIGPAIVTQGFKSLLIKSKDPRVLHVSSGLGSMTMASNMNTPYCSSGWVVYRTSKAALHMFMIENAKELGKDGMKVFGLCPGLVRSNLRGTEAHEVNAGARTGDPEVSGQLMLDVTEGRLDADVSKVVRKWGAYPW